MPGIVPLQRLGAGGVARFPTGEGGISGLRGSPSRFGLAPHLLGEPVDLPLQLPEVDAAVSLQEGWHLLRDTLKP